MTNNLVFTDTKGITTKLVFHYRDYDGQKFRTGDDVAMAMSQAMIFKTPKDYKESSPFGYNYRCSGAALYQDNGDREFAPLVSPGVSVCSLEDRYVKAAGRAIAAARLRANLAKAYRERHISLQQLEVGLMLISRWI